MDRASIREHTPSSRLGSLPARDESLGRKEAAGDVLALPEPLGLGRWNPTRQHAAFVEQTPGRKRDRDSGTRDSCIGTRAHLQADGRRPVGGIQQRRRCRRMRGYAATRHPTNRGVRSCWSGEFPHPPRPEASDRVRSSDPARSISQPSRHRKHEIPAARGVRVPCATYTGADALWRALEAYSASCRSAFSTRWCADKLACASGLSAAALAALTFVINVAADMLHAADTFSAFG